MKDSKMLWNIVRDHAPKAKAALPVSLRDGDTVLSDTQDIRDSFSKFFANIAAEYTSNLPAYRDGCHIVLQDFISSRVAPNKQFTIAPVSLNFVEKQLQLLDNGKQLDWMGHHPYCCIYEHQQLLHPSHLCLTSQLKMEFIEIFGKLQK